MSPICLAKTHAIGIRTASFHMVYAPVATVNAVVISMLEEVLHAQDTPLRAQTVSPAVMVGTVSLATGMLRYA